MSNLPKPFLGRLLLEVIKENAEDHVKKQIAGKGLVSEDFLKQFDLGTEIKAKTKPITKGRIIDLAPDAFGKCFQERYGNDMQIPKLGDIIFFISGESYVVDSENRYHLIADCDIVAYESIEEKESIRG